MKKVLALLIFLVTIYSVYYDLKLGTLPTNVSPTHTPLIEASSHEASTSTIPAETIVVEAGYTVLSIVEELHSSPINATIQQIVHDFETLNPGTDSSKIQIGKAYLFPVYYE